MKKLSLYRITKFTPKQAEEKKELLEMADKFLEFFQIGEKKEKLSDRRKFSREQKKRIKDRKHLK